MYTPEEFDKCKTKVMTYILYKKRTESEVRKKFCSVMEEEILDDIIEYVKEAGYINDQEYIKKLVQEYMNLKEMSIREIKLKLYQKGIYADEINDYIDENREMLEEYELNSARKVFDKKKNLNDKQKIIKYLLNRGFDPDILSKIEN